MDARTRHRWALGLTALLSASLLTFTPWQANADDAAAAPSPAGLEPGESVVVTAAEVANARDDVASGAVDVPDAVDTAMTNELVDVSDDHGIYVDQASVDVVPILDGDAMLAVPVDTDVENVTISYSEDGVLDASVQTAPDPSSDVTESGPQMASTWDPNGSGTYVLKILSGNNHELMADGRFTWARYKLTNDGEPNKVNYLYKRFGDVQPSSLSGQPDPKVDVLRIQSFPFDSVEPDLIEWNKYSPASDRKDDCSTYNASITVFGIGASVPFNEQCGEYNMWRNIDKPSSYWLQYQGGGYGNREVGYVLSWAQKAGTPGSMHDLQQIQISFRFPSPNPNMSCTQTDASRTCDGGP